ncbi:hypothetical protein, partial [uncultured Bilophila sp.]
VPQGRQGGAVSEVWVSYPELAETLGDTGASLLCAAVGGASMFVPRAPVPGSYLTALLGMERMDRLCAAFGGLRIVVPNRRREPYKDRIIRMLDAGKSPGTIALELGVTERYVRFVAQQAKKQPKPQEQLRLW